MQRLLERKNKFFLLIVLLLSNLVFADNFVYTNTSIKGLNCTLGVNPDTINFTLPPSGKDSSHFNLSCTIGNIGLNVTINKTGEISDCITLEKNNITISPLETSSINLNITAMISTTGLYYGKITANSSDQQREINITVNVSNVGRINLTINDTVGNFVREASVFLWLNSNLKDSGSTDANGNWLSKWFSQGNYTVEVSKSGYATQSKNATIITGNITNVFITLEPSGAPLLDVSPSSISESVYIGDTTTKILTIMNIGDMVLDDVYISSSANWASFSKTFIDSISPGNYEIIYAYLSSGSARTFSTQIIINSSNDGSRTIPVIFQVSARPSAVAPAGGGGYTLPPTEESKTIPKIEAGKIVSMNIAKSDELRIEEIEIKTKETVNNVQISVKDIAKPAGPDPIPTSIGATYKYLDISKKNIEDKHIEKVKIRFKIEKSWLEKYNYDKDTTKLNRFHDNKWEGLPTESVGEDLNYLFYEAESSSLSIFAITIEKMKQIGIIDYPSEINITQGGSRIFSVTIKNTGNTVLKGIKLSLNRFQVKISPERVDLEPNARQVFLVEINVSDAEPKEYKLLLKAISEITIERSIKLIVLEKPMKPEIEEEKLRVEIEDIKSLIDNIWNEIVKTITEGRNVTKIFDILSDARGSIDIAESYLRIGKYNETKIKIEDSRGFLENAVTGLATAKYPTVTCPIINISFLGICAIWYVILIFLIIIIVILIRKTKKLKGVYKRITELRRIRSTIRR